MVVLAVPSAHVIVFVSPGGWATTTSDIMTPTRHWRNMLSSRNLPFNVTIEMIDANPINTMDLTKFVAISQPIIKARLTNMSLPKATGWFFDGSHFSSCTMTQSYHCYCLLAYELPYSHCWS